LKIKDFYNSIKIK